MSETGIPNLTTLAISNERLRDCAAFIGEIARPFAIIAGSASASACSIILSMKVNSPEAALYIGAVYAGVGALYLGKAWEKITQIRQGDK